MDIDEIARLIALFGRSSLAELDYSDDRIRIRLARSTLPAPAAPGQAHIPPDISAPDKGARSSATDDRAGDGADAPGHMTQAPAPGDPAAEPPARQHVIAAGFAGTFFRAPSPGADPFVTEGDRIEEGQVLALLEAMKMLNPVEADRAGRIERVLVEDGTPVGAGAALFAIRADG